MSVSTPRALGLALFLSLSTGALAQEAIPVQTFDLERLGFNPSAGASLVTSTGDVLESGDYRVSLLGQYQHRPLVAIRDTGESLGCVVCYRVSAHVNAAWSPFRAFELGLQLPVLLSQGGDPLPSLGLPSLSTAGLGTPVLSARWAPLQQGQGDVLDLSLQVGVGIPIGTGSAYGSDGYVTATPRVGVGRAFSFLRIGADVGVQFRPRRGIGEENVGTAALAALSLTTTNKGLRGELTGRGAFLLSDRSPIATDVLVGVRYPFGSVELFAIGGPGFGGALGNPQFRVFAGAAFQPGLKQEKAAPVAAAASPSSCVEGMPELAASCPDLDLDGDGVKNGSDACLNEKGSEARKGCPAPDSDGDGVDDDADRCPQQVGSDAGCPLPDADNDGIPDAKDACPNEAGDTGSADGCPQKKPEPFSVREQIQFEKSKAKLKPESEPMLDRVAEQLKAHPEVTLLTIEGHTDSKGKRAANVKLSQKRAEAVRDALVKRGIERSRLFAKGLGPDQPIADNNTAEGRDQNRRIEFRVGVPEVKP